MAIGPGGRFDYVAEFTEGSFGATEILLQAQSRVVVEEQVLVGHTPKLRFWNDRVVVLAADSTRSAMRWASFPVGDVVFLVARAGDVLGMVRSGTGDLGLAIVRENQLVVALGAVTELSLGDNVKAANRFDTKDERSASLEIHIGGDVSVLRSRESKNAAGYNVYVERTCTWHWDTDGVAECASIVHTGEPRASNAAIRGAVLLANERMDTLRGEWWDGRYLRAQW
jgi:hypothetical protein